MGKKYVHAYVAQTPLSKEEFEELSIRLNKNHGDWDYDILANEWNIDLLLESGFTDEELHLKIDCEEKKPKCFTITVKFENEDDLRSAESNIADIISKYSTATYKVKVK